MHALILAIKSETTKIIDDFQKKHAKLFDQLLKKVDNMNIAYFIPIHLKKSLVD